MALKDSRVDCPYCGRTMRKTEDTRRSPFKRGKYLCPARCLTRPITRAEAASWHAKNSLRVGLK